MFDSVFAQIGVVVGLAAVGGASAVFSLFVLIGNTAKSILDQLRCSVLAIKPEGFVSPVDQP